jgi:hypothetical protein
MAKDSFQQLKKYLIISSARADELHLCCQHPTHYNV